MPARGGALRSGTMKRPAGAKVTALVSLLLWLGVVCAGRLIAYL